MLHYYQFESVVMKDWRVHTALATGVTDRPEIIIIITNLYILRHELNSRDYLLIRFFVCLS